MTLFKFNQHHLKKKLIES